MTQENREIKNKENEKIRVEELAQKVTLLFGFCADLIKDKDMLKDVLEVSSKRQSDALSMAPILGAFGQDYEEVEFDARIKKERAKALFDLIDTLDRTERERVDFNKKYLEKRKGAAELRKILGY